MHLTIMRFSGPWVLPHKCFKNRHMLVFCFFCFCFCFFFLLLEIVNLTYLGIMLTAFKNSDSVVSSSHPETDFLSVSFSSISCPSDAIVYRMNQHWQKGQQKYFFWCKFSIWRLGIMSRSIIAQYSIMGWDYLSSENDHSVGRSTKMFKCPSVRWEVLWRCCHLSWYHTYIGHLYQSSFVRQPLRHNSCLLTMLSVDPLTFSCLLIHYWSLELLQTMKTLHEILVLYNEMYSFNAELKPVDLRDSSQWQKTLVLVF